MGVITLTKSKLTLEPLPSADQIYKDMVQLYLDERGYGDLFDVYKVLLPIRPDEIGIQLFSVVEDMNENEMLKHGLCPECGCNLVNKYLPGTMQEPPEYWLECPDCQDRHGRSKN